MERVETERLRQFKTVVDAGGLVKAGELLGISAGGLSKSIKTLEAELGYDLFQTKGRGLELTAAGKKLYDRLPGVLKAVEDLVSLSDGSTAYAEPLRLVSFEVFTTYFLSQITDLFSTERPLDVREAIPGMMESLIAEGHGDLGITYLPVPHAGLDFTKVGRIRMGIFGLKGFLKGKAVRDLPFAVPIAPIQGTPSGVQGLDGWPEHLFPRRVVARVEMMETAMQIVRQGKAAAFLPEFVARFANEQGLEKFHLSEAPLPAEVKDVHRDVFLIQRRGFAETKLIREVAKALRRLE